MEENSLLVNNFSVCFSFPGNNVEAVKTEKPGGKPEIV